MSQRLSSRESHQAHADNRNEYFRARALAAHEREVRRRTVERLVGVLVQRPAAHEFRTPVVSRFDSRTVVDWMALPGGPDHTGFCERGVC
jgi:hypothetical protein